MVLCSLCVYRDVLWLSDVAGVLGWCLMCAICGFAVCCCLRRVVICCLLLLLVVVVCFCCCVSLFVHVLCCSLICVVVRCLLLLFGVVVAWWVCQMLVRISVIVDCCWLLVCVC